MKCLRLLFLCLFLGCADSAAIAEKVSDAAKEDLSKKGWAIEAMNCLGEKPDPEGRYKCEIWAKPATQDSTSSPSPGLDVFYFLLYCKPQPGTESCSGEYPKL